MKSKISEIQKKGTTFKGLIVVVLIVFIFCSKYGKSQTANNYIFSTNTGAALLAPTFSSTIVTLSTDDAVSAVQNIGFNFSYEGTVYTQFSVNSNGLLKLGGVVTTSEWSNSFVSTTNVPKLMPLWDDLNSSSNGGIRFGTYGTTPNRILVVDYRTYYTNSTAPYNCSYQIWLYESTNEIRFVYSTGTTPGSFSCGIGGAIATNFLSVTTSSHTCSSSTANNSNNTWPGSGRYYRFLPCAASLTQTGPSLSCAYTNISYTATPSGFAGTPSYQWYYSNADGSSVVAFASSSGSGNAPYYTSYSGGQSQTLNINTFGGPYDHMHIWCVATYGGCSATSNSIALVTESAITAPVSGSHTASQTQIIWNWNAVTGATGYKWNTTNNYATATDMGTNLSKTETGLACNTSYSRYVWAYKACGYSSATTLSATTSACCTTPVISNMSVSVCSGSAFTLTPVNGTNGTVPAGTTYSWQAPYSATAYTTASGSGAASISGMLNNTTISTVNVVYVVTPVSGSCTGAAFNVTVSVLPRPRITPNPVTPFCYGGSRTLTASTLCATPTYEWYRNGTSTGVTASTYSPTSPGLYFVKINCNGCSSSSDPVAVVVQGNEFDLSVTQPSTTNLAVGDYVWSGNTSTNWNVASNWLVYNGSSQFANAPVVPDSTKNVFIRAYTGCAANLCNIMNGNTGLCKSITIESSLTMNLVSSLEVARNWTNTTGTFNCGTGTVIFNGQKNTTGTLYTGGDGVGKRFYNVEIKSASNTTSGSNDGNKVNLENNIRINNNFVLSSGYQFNVNSGSLMSIGGNFTHNICEFNRGTGSVTLTGAGKVIDGSAATYFRILNISGSYTLNATHMYLWSNPLGSYGDINIQAGGSFNASSNTVHIDGSWTNNGTFTASTSTVILERGYTQNIKSGGYSFYNLSLNKTATPPYITMTDPACITNYGNFICGVINYSGTGSLTFTDNATSNGGAANSFVNGPVNKTGNENFMFPVGKVTTHILWQPHVWAPLNINNTAGTATDQFRCEYYFSAAPNNWGSQYMCDFSLLNHVSAIEYWDLSRLVGASVPWVSLYWKNSSRSCIQNPSGLVVAHWENCPSTMTNKWASKGGTVVEDIAGVAGHVTNTIAFPNFSPVTFGTIINNNTLPVVLIGFSAKCTNGKVVITWETASETNCDYFKIERSEDGVNWEILSTVTGAGNSNSIIQYSETDIDPFSENTYYRLKQVDFNGQYQYFNSVSVSCDNATSGSPSAVFYPNPFSSDIRMEISGIPEGKATVKVFGIYGNEIFSKDIIIIGNNESFVFDLSQLSAGVYTISVVSGGFSSVEKIVKE